MADPSLTSQTQFLEHRIRTDISVLSSRDGMSRRSRKRFSGTGGISSGRTTGFSLLLCSFSPSASSSSSSLSSGSPSSSTGLQELFMEVDAKEYFVMQMTRVNSFLIWHACGACVTCKNIQKLFVFVILEWLRKKTNLCLLGVKSFFFDSLRFFFARLFLCLLRLRRLCFSSVSLCSSAAEEGWGEDSREPTEESVEWKVRFLLPSSTVAENNLKLWETSRLCFKLNLRPLTPHRTHHRWPILW